MKMFKSLFNEWAPLVVRVLIGYAFLVSGYQTLSQASAIKAGATSGLFTILMVLTVIAIVGAVSVLIGWKARYGGLLLAFVVLANTILTAYQALGQNVSMSVILTAPQILQSLTLIGGLLCIAIHGISGRWTVEGMRKTSSRESSEIQYTSS
ncbi:MAG: DoxX family protein [Patescibacteria group bacterium]